MTLLVVKSNIVLVTDERLSWRIGGMILTGVKRSTGKPLF